jgi:hypothetical protein
MLRVGSRVDIGENIWFEVYQFEQIEKRKGKVHLIVLKDGKRTFEKRVARAEEGTQKVYNFKFQGENYRLLIRK